MNSNKSFIFRHIFLLILLTLTAHSHSQQISATDLDALLHLTYTLTDVKPGDYFSTWNFTSPENMCTSFNGVTCSIINNEYRVTSLFLGTGLSDSPGLAGTISDSIYNLTELTQLILYPGIVTGFIPQEIGSKCNKLRVLSLTNNRLTGSIPESLSGLQNLHTLDLSHNRLTGPIPPSLQKMKVMVLAFNRLAGKIPDFSSESEVMHLDLRNNMFSGTLPENMPLSVRYLSLSSNGLWGPVNSIRSENLVYLDLSMNKFSGPVPVGFFKGSLSSMYLQRNNFSGEILLPSTSAGFEPYGPGNGT
ncbi:Leucine-rich repeat-containing protein [Artemisia annua]|uniref:Leucine-rich repeat-containing protein n=1 Tax=Artemisia annua TaxID=35608 RepID=A0A2U1KED4_ARTAN|nr:Leucine-rich repeat-containing protein [Artemisia annua]